MSSCSHCIERYTAYLYYSRREQKPMVRSSSDSNYYPRCASADNYQLYDLKNRVHSVDVPVRTEPHYLAPVTMEDHSPHNCETQATTQVLCKKISGHSGEIIVKKLPSKPAPPPRKYYKQDTKDDVSPLKIQVVLSVYLCTYNLWKNTQEHFFD